MTTTPLNPQEQPPQRMTMMIEAAMKSAFGDIDTLGFVEGTVSVGQTVYIVNPACTQQATVSAIEDSRSVSRSTIADERAHLFLRNAIVVEGDASKAGFSFGTVVGTQRPCVSNDCRKVENTYLSGLLPEVDRGHDSKDFANLLGFTLCNATFIVPVQTQSGPKVAEGPIDTSDTSIGLYWLELPGGVPELPVFTDWAALQRDTHIAEGGDEPEARLAGLGELLQILRMFGPEHSLVINPFGPGTFPLERVTLERLSNTAGFRAACGESINDKLAKADDKGSAASAAGKPSASAGKTSIAAGKPVGSAASQPTATDQAEKERKLWELLTEDD